MQKQQIDDYPNYTIYEDGRVFASYRNVWLKPNTHKNGYQQYRLFKNGYQRGFLVHRLVAKAFIPNYDNKMEINHIDGDKTNNHVNNLEWSTRSENMKHAYAIGIRIPYPRRKGDTNKNITV